MIPFEFEPKLKLEKRSKELYLSTLWDGFILELIFTCYCLNCEGLKVRALLPFIYLPTITGGGFSLCWILELTLPFNYFFLNSIRELTSGGGELKDRLLKCGRFELPNISVLFCPLLMLAELLSKWLFYWIFFIVFSWLESFGIAPGIALKDPLSSFFYSLLKCTKLISLLYLLSFRFCYPKWKS